MRRCREAPSNLYAVIIEPREILVEVYAKNRNWEPVILRQRDKPIDMPESDLHCSVAELYRGTPLDPQRHAGQHF